MAELQIGISDMNLAHINILLEGNTTHPLPSTPHDFKHSADCCCSNTHTCILNDKPQKYNQLYLSKKWSWSIFAYHWFYITSVTIQGEISMKSTFRETK